ncbi:MAG TPA: glutamate synthase subunit beta [Cyclobacteriaceae bacterium]|jgi:glutamate synthase (NADPH/NADH) small chain|nr:glutamate synthase subunit beta [Cytophagales bacterium]HNT49240.1 glutamate synthase subunit beta [Cyclobacteriaceae bacterium]HRE66782.1 glutamate synthase subunit beta [Cyclobacteriaceae bacterium]HRF33280.1 glutamate synthase subunit beta [Cyclobacteriaceae bacterium]
MGKPTGFLEQQRELPHKRDPKKRINDYNEVDPVIDEGITVKQASRCMDCGIPFCHNGCPLGNIIPEFNDAVYQENWKLAYEILISTNNFPEFTGRICPAPCEASCVLGINKPPVAIEYIEKSIIERAFQDGYAKPRIPVTSTNKKIAIVGSGPSGLAAAAQLNYAGHQVTVFERADEIGGLLRYGIPDFKLDKQIVDRRVQLMTEEGVKFQTNANVGVNISVTQIKEEFDAILLCGGSTIPRDLPIPGRELKGVHYAMDFLTQQNCRVAGKKVNTQEIWATGKNVVVIGGGDTGSDCVGTSNRHGAKSVTQIEILSKPPKDRTASMPWPSWPMILRTSTSHEEGCERNWSIVTKEFIGDDQGNLKALKIAEVEMKNEPGKPPVFVEIAGSEKEIPCELALLAMGFLHPQHNGLVEQLSVDRDERGNVKATNYKTSVEDVFAAGDMRRGQSLVVWAISEGREAARAVDQYLVGQTTLEAKEQGILSLVE